LAYQGIDFRDLYRRGSGMSLRRLMVLLRALPAEAPLWAELEAAAEAAKVAPADEIRERQQAFERRNAARRREEEAS
jgi:hypothetical protein